MEKKAHSKQAKITKIKVTNDKISGRGGLFFMKYVENIRFFKLFENRFGFVKGSSKGLCCFEFIKQLVLWFIDGTDTSMKSFDRRKGVNVTYKRKRIPADADQLGSLRG